MSFGSSFLVHPDLFPARRAGEPWGRGEVLLDVAAGPYAFRGLSPSQAAAVRERFGALCLDPEGETGVPAVETLLFRADERDFHPIETRGWTYSLDLETEPAAVRVAGRDLVARLEWRPAVPLAPGVHRGPVSAVPGALAGALWTPVDGGAAFQGPFENYFRVLVAYRLLAAGGVLLHSAGLVKAGRAHLFCGSSGAGKSTLCRLAAARGGEVLSDELNALWPGSRGAGGEAVGTRVERLPFAGDFGHVAAPRSSHPLAAVYRLEKAPATKWVAPRGAEPGEAPVAANRLAPMSRLAPLSRGEAVATLAACAPCVNADPHRQERLLANLAALVAGAPAAVLTFGLDGGFWDILT